MDTDTLDELDRKVLQALQLDGRAPFSRIAAVLDVSDQTIARCYKRMRSSGSLRVLGMADESRLGRTIWLIRLHCTPDGSERLAGALTRRADTSYVALISGGTEVTCAMRPRTDAARNEMLLDRLRHTPRVIGFSAHCLLHRFYGGPVGGLNKISALSAAEEDALRGAGRRACGGPGGHDRRGRGAAVGAPARRAGPHARTAEGLGPGRGHGTPPPDPPARHRHPLLRDPVRPGTARTACHGDAVAVGVPAALSAAGIAMAEHHEVNIAAAITGQSNVFAVLVCEDTRQLYTYLSQQIGALDGVRSVETALVLCHIKRLALEPGRDQARQPISADK